MEVRVQFTNTINTFGWGQIIEAESISTMKNIMVMMQRSIAKTAPKRSGALERSIQWVLNNPHSGEVFANSPYAHVQEFGAVIRPRRALFLHWVDATTGEDVFAREVHIPGTHFFEKGMAAAEPLIMKALSDSGSKIAVRMGFYGI